MVIAQGCKSAKSSTYQITTKPLVGIKHKGIVIAGVKYIISLSVWTNPFNKTDTYTRYICAFKLLGNVQIQMNFNGNYLTSLFFIGSDSAKITNVSIPLDKPECMRNFKFIFCMVQFGSPPTTST